MRNSPRPGVGIARVPRVTGFPTSVTKRAFWVLLDIIVFISGLVVLIEIQKKIILQNGV